MSIQKITEIIPIEKLQSFQKQFSDTFRMSSLIIDLNGNPITEEAHAHDFCRLVRHSSKNQDFYRKMIDQTLSFPDQSTPVFFRHPFFEEMLFAFIPIILHGKHLASWISGQVFEKELSDEKVLEYQKKLNIPFEEFTGALKTVPYFAEEEFKKIHFFLNESIQTLSYFGCRCHDLTEKNQENQKLIEIENKKLKENEEKQTILLKKLEESNAELKQFAYAASHDLKEPLRMINNFLRLIQRHIGKTYGKDPKLDEFSFFALDALKRMEEFIDGILYYSRANAPIKQEEIDLNKLMTQVLFYLQIPLQEKKADVIYKNLPVIQADKNHMFQLFQNLISNALKYSAPEIPLKISIEVTKKENQHLFSIKDNGMGIEGENLKKIFMIFQRLHAYQDIPGSGIGLALCKKIVERYEGEIWAESEKQKGTVFFFTLPSCFNHE